MVNPRTPHRARSASDSHEHASTRSSGLLSSAGRRREMSSKETVKRSFSERASEWAASYADPELQSLNLKNLMARQRFAVQMVETSLPRGSKILDIGCGPGEMAAKLIERGYEVWGVDIAEPMVRYASERCGANRFRVGDIEQIPFPDRTFDGAVC